MQERKYLVMFVFLSQVRGAFPEPVTVLTTQGILIPYVLQLIYQAWKVLIMEASSVAGMVFLKL